MCVECKGNHKITIDDCQSIAHSRDGECLSTIYINNHSKLVWKCFNGVRYHSFEMMMVRFNGNIDKALNYHQMNFYRERNRRAVPDVSDTSSTGCCTKIS